MCAVERSDEMTRWQQWIYKGRRDRLGQMGNGIADGCKGRRTWCSTMCRPTCWSAMATINGNLRLYGRSKKIISEDARKLALDKITSAESAWTDFPIATW